MNLKAESGKELVRLHVLEPVREPVAETAHSATAVVETSAPAERGFLAKMFKTEQGAVRWGKVSAVSVGAVLAGGALLYDWRARQSKQDKASHER